MNRLYDKTSDHLVSFKSLDTVEEGFNVLILGSQTLYVLDMLGNSNHKRASIDV